MTRAEAIEILEHNWTSLHNPDYTDEELGQALDVAIASLETDEAYQLEYEKPTTKNDLGVDAVSRQAVIDLMMQKWGENFSGDDAMQESIDAIRVMPSTPQEPKTGHWNNIPKYKDIAWQCSECKHFTTMKHNYCPNCGCRMDEPQESEDT